MLKHDTHLLFQPTSGTTTSTSAAATPVTSARTTASSKGLTLVSEEKNICMECNAEYKNAVSCPSGAVSGFQQGRARFLGTRIFQKKEQEIAFV